MTFFATLKFFAFLSTAYRSNSEFPKPISQMLEIRGVPAEKIPTKDASLFSVSYGTHTRLVGKICNFKIKMFKVLGQHAMLGCNKEFCRPGISSDDASIL